MEQPLINEMFLFLFWCVLFMVIDYVNALGGKWGKCGVFWGHGEAKLCDEWWCCIVSCGAMWVVCLFKQSWFGAVILSWWLVCELVCLCTSGCFMITCLKMDSWDHRHFPLLTMCHEPGRNHERDCGHIYRLSLRAFDVSHALSWYYCILALKAMYMVLGLWFRAGEVHIGTQIMLIVKVSKSNLEYVSNILK